MKLDFIHRIDINRPVAELFEYLSELENNPIWQGGIQSCSWTSTERCEVGPT